MMTLRTKIPGVTNNNIKINVSSIFEATNAVMPIPKTLTISVIPPIKYLSNFNSYSQVTFKADQSPRHNPKLSAQSLNMIRRATGDI